MAAVERCDIPAKVYWTTVSHSGLLSFVAAIKEAGVDWDEPDDAAGGEPEIGVPDDQVTTSIDVSEVLAQTRAALAAHGSQGDNVIFLRLSPERFASMMAAEQFVRVRDRTGAPLPEDDLFAGLR
jgi:hypothetical protein